MHFLKSLVRHAGIPPVGYLQFDFSIRRRKKQEPHRTSRGQENPALDNLPPAVLRYSYKRTRSKAYEKAV
jgi:hypothetical protein